MVVNKSGSEADCADSNLIPEKTIVPAPPTVILPILLFCTVMSPPWSVVPVPSNMPAKYAPLAEVEKLIAPVPVVAPMVLPEIVAAPFNMLIPAGVEEDVAEENEILVIVLLRLVI
mgnify:CR=1 FL=1